VGRSGELRVYDGSTIIHHDHPPRSSTTIIHVETPERGQFYQHAQQFQVEASTATRGPDA
jgi:hypothetical protein